MEGGSGKKEEGKEWRMGWREWRRGGRTREKIGEWRTREKNGKEDEREDGREWRMKGERTSHDCTYLREILVYDGQGHLVNVSVLVLLKGLNLVQATTLFKHHAGLIKMLELVCSLDNEIGGVTAHAPTDHMRHKSRHATFTFIRRHAFTQTPHPKNICDRVQENGDQLGILDDQEIAQWLESTCLDHSHNLLEVPTSSDVVDGPDCLLLRSVFSLQ